MGHVQDSPVSNNMISNEFMIHHMKVPIVSYNLGQKKFQTPNFIFAHLWTNGLQTSYSDATTKGLWLHCELAHNSDRDLLRSNSRET